MIKFLTIMMVLSVLVLGLSGGAGILLIIWSLIHTGHWYLAVPIIAIVMLLVSFFALIIKAG